MIIYGIDQSVAKAGFATPAGTEVVKPPKDVDDVARLLWWFRWSSTFYRKVSLDLVALEGYSHASKHKQHEVGEAVGAVKMGLRSSGVRLVVIPPGSLKKFVTGKGNCSKVELASTVSARTGIVFANDDEADAYALRQMALAQFDPNSEDLTMAPTNAKHREALAGVDWPVVL